MIAVVTIPELAKRIGVHPATVWRWCEAGRGPRCIKTPGNVRLFEEADVGEWVETLRSGGQIGGDATS